MLGVVLFPKTCNARHWIVSKPKKTAACFKSTANKDVKMMYNIVKHSLFTDFHELDRHRGRHGKIINPNYSLNKTNTRKEEIKADTERILV